jgi:hypothetical protein
MYRRDFSGDFIPEPGIEAPIGVKQLKNLKDWEIVKAHNETNWKHPGKCFFLATSFPPLSFFPLLSLLSLPSSPLYRNPLLLLSSTFLEWLGRIFQPRRAL